MENKRNLSVRYVRSKIQQADKESIWSAMRRISLSLNVIFAEESFLISVT